MVRYRETGNEIQSRGMLTGYHQSALDLQVMFFIVRK